MNIINGFILTAHATDSYQGLNLEYWGNSDLGPFKIIIENEKVVFFVESTLDCSQLKGEEKELKLSSFDGKKVKGIYFKTLKDFYQARKYCTENGIRTYESDIRPEERFLMERFINNQIQFHGEYSEVDGVKVYRNPNIKSGNTFSKLSLLSIDIETGSDGSLYSIAYDYMDTSERVGHVFMRADLNEKINKELTYCSNEKEVIEQFLTRFHQLDPDLIIGWHVIGFDFKFLEKKCLKYNIPFNFGRQNSLMLLDERKGAGWFATLKGRVVIDGPPALRSNFYTYPNFKLDTVATEVLGVGKDISSDENKVNEIERRFRDDKESLAKYNLLDCQLVTDIYNKLNLVDLLLTRSIISGLAIDRLGISTAAFDHIMLPLIHRKGYVAPNSIDIEREAPAGGGLVITPELGMHEYVAVFDFKSLYPSIIKTFKIDPYSLIKSEIDSLRIPTGVKFSKTEHILPDVIDKLLTQRSIAKQQNNSNLSQAIKILMNSFYGVMGSSRCRFYHADLPNAITETGQWCLKTVIEFFQNHNYEVIYGDTDSVFVKLKEHEHDNYEDQCEKLTILANDFMKRLILDEFGVESFLDLEFEKCFYKIFFPMSRGSDGAAKKRYAGFIGGAENPIEFIGLEYVRSDWTDLAKDFQLNLYQRLFNDEDILGWLKSYVKEIENGLHDEKLVYTKRLSKDPKEYVKNVPPHVKAALLVNHTGPYRLKSVSYVYTKNGPIPIQNDPSDIDYQHYIEKQIKPLADSVLFHFDSSFDQLIVGDQLSLF